ncbi:S1/P1 nuclease [Spongorhabdus nitratireducens]
MKTLIIALLLWPTLLLPSPAQAWFDAGHMASSWIAWQQLTPETRKQVQTYLDVLKDAEPETDNFMVASTWLDNIKQTGLGVTLYWHTASREQAIMGQAEGPANQNGVWIVQQAVRTLENPQASRFAKALMLRALIHVVQDLHQPLHVCDDDPERPYGAAHCYKAFRIRPVQYGHEQLINLHDLWDSALTAAPSVRYNDQQALAQAEQYGKTLLQRVNLEDLPALDETDPKVWVLESEKLLSDFAVSGLKPGQQLSDNYLAVGKQIAEQRLVTAAWRLANLLNRVFDASSATKH